MPGTTVLNPETLKEQSGGLTDAQFDAIEAEERLIREEEDKPKKDDSEEKEEEGEGGAKEEESEEGDEAEDAEAKAKAEAEAKKKDEPEKKDEEGKEKPAEKKEEKPVEKSEEDKKAEEAKAVAELEAKAIELAKAENITIQEAKTELEHIRKQKEKYSADPDKLARTVLHSQREYSKLQEDNKLLKERVEAAETALNQRVIKVPQEDGSVKTFDLRTEDGRAEWKVAIVESYRADHAKETENLDDDQVFKEAQKKFESVRTEKQRSARKQIAEKASSKRTQLIESLPESNKRYLPEIEPLLKEYPDHVIASDEFKMEDVVRWARGGPQYDEDIKSAEKRGEELGFKRGQENAKILGAGSKGGPSGKTPPKSKGGFVNDLSEREKQAALDMYEGVHGMTDEDKFKEYRTLYKKGEA